MEEVSLHIDDKKQKLKKSNARYSWPRFYFSFGLCSSNKTKIPFDWHDGLAQWFSNCGTRTTSGTRELF